MIQNSQAPERFAVDFDLIQDELKKKGFKTPLKAYRVLGNEFKY